jgi:hypothetical protein
MQHPPVLGTPGGLAAGSLAYQRGRGLSRQPFSSRSGTRPDDACDPYMVRGGYTAFDDALYASCIGATEVVEESVTRKGRTSRGADLSPLRLSGGPLGTR